MRPIDADALLEKIDTERDILVKDGRLGTEHILVHYVRNFIEDAPTIDAEPTILSVGVVKEYDNGMVAMRKETYQEYHAIAVNEAVRRLGVEVLSEIERSTSI